MRRASLHPVRQIALLLLVVAACSGESARRSPSPSPTVPPLVIEKTRLGRLPRHLRPGSAVVAPDGAAFAVVATERDGDRVVSSTGGVESLHAVGTLISFVPKSHRLVYWVSEGTDDSKTWDLVADGTVHRTKSFLPGPLAFSADGSRWAVAIFEPGQPAGKIEAVRILSNGTELGRYADASGPSVSPDGAHVAYLAVADGRPTLFVDGVARATFEAPAAPCAKAAFAEADQPDMPPRHVVHYLGDGRLLVVTRDADGWGLYVDGTRIAAYPISTFDRIEGDCQHEASIGIPSIRPAETSTDLFWWERLAGETAVWRVVKNGVPVDTITCSEPWRRHPPETSADGKHLVYPCSTLLEGDVREVRLVKDGAVLGTFMDVWGPALSPNGAHVAVATADGSPARPWSLVVDGHSRLGGFEAIWRPRVSDDGNTIAWQAKREKKGRGLFGIDARVIGSFDEVLWGPEPEGAERMAWVIRRGRTLTRVSVPIAVATQPDRPVAVVSRPAPAPSPRATHS